jgi:hypothetical protein
LHVSLARSVKNLLVPKGFHTRTVLTGPFKGIRMDLDLQTQSQFYLGLFEQELHPWIGRFAAGVRTVVDIGAAHGEYTCFALLKTGAERVITFEPDPIMVRRLQRNVNLNSGVLSHLSVHPKCLGSSDSDDCVSVETLRRWISPPCLLKMDIDGGEVEVLRAAAASGLLDVPGLRWVIETHAQSFERDCISILESHRYFTKVIPNAWWRVIVPEQRVSVHNRWLVATNESPDLARTWHLAS